MKKLLLFLCCVPMLMAATCEDNDDDLSCRNANAGVRIIVRDAVTNENMVDGVTVEIQDVNSDYSETLQPVFEADSYRFYGAYGRPGTYEVRASKPGYASYTSNSLLVVTLIDRCSVTLAGRVINLQPL